MLDFEISKVSLTIGIIGITIAVFGIRKLIKTRREMKMLRTLVYFDEIN